MEIRTPFLLVNLKVYDEAINNYLGIVKVAKKVADELDVNITIAPSHLVLKEVSKIIPTFAQSIDSFEPGAHTGSIIAEEIKKCGAVGALINHSEKRLTAKDVKVCVERCRQNELVSVVCVANVIEAKEYAKFYPDFIAIEPPELIGKISVSAANPKIVSDSVNAVKGVSKEVGVLCGAGIKTKEDIQKALELGVVGVLVSSGIVKDKNIENAIREAATALKSVRI
ncbi:MAG: triose-phosphate isomerase [Candidatus Aenigmarchaeota archaeon]|nr:triose-phosphate isomerase [Candidatus Aenigmarchaeota archaeon]